MAICMYVHIYGFQSAGAQHGSPSEAGQHGNELQYRHTRPLPMQALQPGPGPGPNKVVFKELFVFFDKTSETNQVMRQSNSNKFSC